MTCKWDGCTKEVFIIKTGYCTSHYAKTYGKECKIDGCVKNSVGRGYCSMHYQRLLKYNDPYYEVTKKRFPGDTYINGNGYVVEYFPDHIQSFKDDGRVLQHRRIMSDKLGRRLYDYENVHHKNGNRADNRLDNLELWVVRQPYGQRVEDLIEYAKWILNEYGQ